MVDGTISGATGTDNRWQHKGAKGEVWAKDGNQVEGRHQMEEIRAMHVYHMKKKKKGDRGNDNGNGHPKKGPRRSGCTRKKQMESTTGLDEEPEKEKKKGKERQGKNKTKNKNTN